MIQYIDIIATVWISSPVSKNIVYKWEIFSENIYDVDTAVCNKGSFVKAVIRLASAGRIAAHPALGARPHPVLLLVPHSPPQLLLARPHRTISWLLLWSMERTLEFVDKFLTYCNSWPWNFECGPAWSFRGQLPNFSETSFQLHPFPPLSSASNWHHVTAHKSLLRFREIFF